MKRYVWVSCLIVGGIGAALLWLNPVAGGAQNRDGSGTASASRATPSTPDGHPDLSGLWIVGTAPRLLAGDNGNIAVGLNARDGSGANAERDGFLRRRM